MTIGLAFEALKATQCGWRYAQWGKDKKVAILQMHFQTLFFLMKIAVFDSNFTDMCLQGYN